MKFLKNYTSDVPVSQTIYRIEQVLIKCGVTGIAKEYAGTDGEIIAVSFHVESPSGMLSIRLPADKEKATQALWLDYVDGDKLTDKGDELHWNTRKRKKRSDFTEQGARTAWKIVQDWVEVQMSMIQLQQADTLQVFLPYVMVNRKQNFYQQVVERNYAGLLPEKT